MLFKSFGGASDFVLEFPGLSPGVQVAAPVFVECVLCSRALVPGVGFDPRGP